MHRRSSLASLVCWVGLLATEASAGTNVAGGALPGNATWTAAGSPYQLTGDLRVPAGVTLTMQPGTEVVVSSTDASSSGTNTSKVEITVDGTLAIQGTAAAPVKIRGTDVPAVPDTWRGFILNATASVRVEHLVLSGPGVGFDISGAAATFQFSHVHVSACSIGAQLNTGSARFTYSHVLGCGKRAFDVSTGTTLELDHVVVADTQQDYALQLRGTANLFYVTLANNLGGGIMGDGAAAFLTVRDSILSNNGGAPPYGIDTSTGGSGSIGYSNFWDYYNDPSSTVSEAPATSMISTDPLFVSATNLHLKDTLGNNPCIGISQNAQTIGAYAGPATKVIISDTSPRSVPVNGTLDFTASAFDRASTEIWDRRPNWAVTQGGGTIDANGVFKAGTKAGTFANTVNAGLDGVFGTQPVTVNVLPGPLHHLAVAEVTVKVKEAVQLSAGARDSFENTIPGAISPTWTAPEGGTVNAAGAFSAGTKAGTFNVQAAIPGATGIGTITVKPGAAARIAITPGPLSVGRGGSQTFTATAADAYGNDITDAVTWSAAPQCGTITPEGVFTASDRTGNYPGCIKATLDAASESAPVVITFADADGSPSSVVGCDAVGGAVAGPWALALLLWSLRRRRS